MSLQLLAAVGGDGSAVSLQLLAVGKRHCRLLYIIPAQPELISADIKGGHGSAVSLQLLGVGKRHCRLLYIIPAQPELISVPCPYNCSR